MHKKGKFEGQCGCLGENPQKYTTYSVPIEKEVIRISLKGKKNRTMSYRFQWEYKMARPLPNPVNNLAEGIRRVKCKYR